jgi:hypothetical protein
LRKDVHGRGKQKDGNNSVEEKAEGRKWFT